MDYAKRFNIRCFIETGTYTGDKIAVMTNSFDELHSINTIDKLRDFVMRHRPDLNMSVERDIFRIHPYRS